MLSASALSLTGSFAMSSLSFASSAPAVADRMHVPAISLNDGRTECAWDCDQGILRTEVWHHLAAIVDGGPKIITFVMD